MAASKLGAERGAQGTGSKVDGAFVATLLETASVTVVYLAWRSITEGAPRDPGPSRCGLTRRAEDWSDDPWYVVCLYFLPTDSDICVRPRCSPLLMSSELHSRITMLSLRSLRWVPVAPSRVWFRLR